MNKLYNGFFSCRNLYDLVMPRNKCFKRVSERRENYLFCFRRILEAVSSSFFIGLSYFMCLSSNLFNNITMHVIHFKFIFEKRLLHTVDACFTSYSKYTSIYAVVFCCRNIFLIFRYSVLITMADIN